MNTVEQTDARKLYLDLMKNALTFFLWGETEKPFAVPPSPWWRKFFYKLLKSFLGKRDIKLMRNVEFNKQVRIEGKDKPIKADTMIGFHRLNNLQHCLEEIIQNNIPGDVIETGVWRGGACIFMRSILKAYNITDKIVWVVDSFEGFPKPNPEKYPVDKNERWHLDNSLSVSIDIVKNNFERYGLLDDKVKFLKGWFKDTLPAAPIEQLSLMRLDGDLYESTMDSLTHLYSKLVTGGYIIIDDYSMNDSCIAAVSDFRNRHNISTPMVKIDWTGVYWKKELRM